MSSESTPSRKHATKPNSGGSSLGGSPPRQGVTDTAVDPSLLIEIVPGELYYTSLSYHPASNDEYQFFTVDYDLLYEPFFADFGPLNLACVVKFCRALQRQRSACASGLKIVFYSSHNGHKRANAACLMGLFCVAVLKMSPSRTWGILNSCYPPFLPFRDASYGISAYNLSIFDVLSGFQKAIQLGWFDLEMFNLDEYEHYEKIENGDWNWIVPKKFIAFSSPVDGIPDRSTDNVSRVFVQNGVQVIVRLNEKMYDKRPFTECGIRVAEMEYEDGSTPTDHIVNKFLTLCQQTKGVVAVHCKAGLGRTGTMIGTYVMKHYGFSSREFIGWSRLCRPGFVIGPQQQYLDAVEKRLSRLGPSTAKPKCGGKGSAVVPLPFMTPTQSWMAREDAVHSMLNTTTASTSTAATSGAAFGLTPTPSPRGSHLGASMSRPNTTLGSSMFSGSRNKFRTPDLLNTVASGVSRRNISVSEVKDILTTDSQRQFPRAATAAPSSRLRLGSTAVGSALGLSRPADASRGGARTLSAAAFRVQQVEEEAVVDKGPFSNAFERPATSQLFRSLTPASRHGLRAAH
jgi:protein-tyrosine phosphatase